MDQVVIGTLFHMLSKMEFHPQWDTNPPIALWARTFICGAQPQIILLSPLRSRNPSGKISLSSMPLELPPSLPSSLSRRPGEPVAATLEPKRDLPHLGRVEGTHASKAEEHHRQFQLSV